MSDERTFLELGPHAPQLPAALKVLRQLRVQRSLDQLAALYKEGHETSGYRLTALVVDDAVQAVAGYRILTNTAWGRHLYVDDLVTRSDARSSGYGRALLAHLAERARAEGCETLTLDSGTHRVDAHRFYRREGMVVAALHFQRDLPTARS